jgi:hypothetical protein
MRLWASRKDWQLTQPQKTLEKVRLCQQSVQAPGKVANLQCRRSDRSGADFGCQRVSVASHRPALLAIPFPSCTIKVVTRLTR